MSSALTFANHPTVLESVSGGHLPALLESEIRKIYERSPLYAQRFILHSEPLRWSCYREIPTLSKKEIVERGHQAFFADYAVIERGLADRKFEYESTGGTTQSPMTVIMEDGWWNAQTARAYRAHPLLAPYGGPGPVRCPSPFAGIPVLDVRAKHNPVPGPYSCLVHVPAPIRRPSNIRCLNRARDINFLDAWACCVGHMRWRIKIRCLSHV